MQNSPTLAIACLLLLVGFVAFASAQEPTPAPVKPVDYQNGSTCEARATRHLVAATDPTKRVDQDWNLKAADAYERLAGMGFKEC